MYNFYVTFHNRLYTPNHEFYELLSYPIVSLYSRIRRLLHMRMLCDAVAYAVD